MKKTSIVATLAIMLITACAVSGTKFSTIKASLPSLDPELGRIFFYRPPGFGGGGLRPYVVVNDQPTKRAKPGGIFYIDTKPGRYNITAWPALNMPLSFDLHKGEVLYVRMKMAPQGKYLQMKVFEESVAEPFVSGLAYTGD